jgi:protein O-GlcNAc transferase
MRRVGTVFSFHKYCFVLWALYLAGTDIGTPNGSVRTCHAADGGNSDAEYDILGGGANFGRGLELFEQQRFEKAVPFLWKSILTHSLEEESSYAARQHNPEYPYTVENVFLIFMQCFARQGKLADGYLYVAKQYIHRRQSKEAESYLNQALSIDPGHREATLWKKYMGGNEELSEELASLLVNGNDNGNHHGSQDNSAQGYTPEELHDKGTDAFNNKKFDRAAEYFEQSCIESNEEIGPSCANAVFCRTEVLDWGYNGTQFSKDMKRVEDLTYMEAMTLSVKDRTTQRVRWQRATSVHPHMMLGYPLDARLQKIVDEAYADTDEMRARVVVNPSTGRAELRDLPSEFPIDQQAKRLEYLEESKDPSFKIRVGFVSSAIKASAVMYLGHSIFQFIDRNKFEIHIFATSPPDNPAFIAAATGGADWRERVKANVDVFHEIPHMQEDHIGLARYVMKHRINIMLDWDGYARQGLRPQGLFALRPSPVQMLHQEFLGTSGAHYVDYLLTDEVTSPPHLASQLYTEKLIYLPNHFFSKGHAIMPEIYAPQFKYKNKTNPYQPGTGTPQSNKCLTRAGVNKRHDATFVFCNFHKFLKYNPETVRSWLTILDQVPDSLLCLLENPVRGVPNFRSFVDDINPALNQRIHFLPWENNLINHQRRNRDLCNVVLDTWPYNGHTTTMDALYAGVPVVTRSDGDHMASRVTTSANLVLGMPELNANGLREYENVAVELASNATWFTTVRENLIESCLQTKPMHVFWDVKLYTKHIQNGLELAWKFFLSGEPPRHIYVANESVLDSHTRDTSKNNEL